MATLQAKDILEGVATSLKNWANGAGFQAVVNGQKGALQAQDIFLQIQAIDWSASENQYSELREAIAALQNERKIFKSDRKFLAFQLLLVCAALAAKCLADQSVAAIEKVRTVKVIDFDTEFLVDPIFIYRTPNPDEGIIYIHLDGIDAAKFGIKVAGSGTATPFQLAHALTLISKAPGKVVTLIDTDIDISKSRAIAFARAAALNSGLHFHLPTTYSGTSIVRSLFHPKPNSSLEQFSDIQQVLSECFAETDVINRYLRLYQVLENFMIRRQIIAVQRSSGSNSFSIRDFKRLYGQVEQREEDLLIALCDAAMSIPTLVGGISLPEVIANRWNTQVQLSGNQGTIATGLYKTIGAYPKKAGIFNTLEALRAFRNPQDRHKLLGRIAYSFRNMIVHNKETEFHLTHISIPPGIAIFMNDFLIPCVDDLIFSMLNMDQSIVWYPQPTIDLYST